MTACDDTVAPLEAHQALFYGDPDEYLEGISRFIDPAVQAGEPVAIALPTDKLKLVGDQLGERVSDVELLDMVELGRNPGRIIPAVQAMIERHGQRPLHYVGEPIWKGRSAAEIREATRHEALINLAWQDAAVRVLCPYDTVALEGEVLADAERTHPGIVRDGRLDASRAYTGPTVPPGCDERLPDPPPEALAIPFELDDLRRVRGLVAAEAAAVGLQGDRAADLVMAVNELTTNTVKHADERGVLRLWRTDEELICQVEDTGHIADPLAGRRRELAGAGGLGLWMVNQLCALVEVRTGADGTTIRVHTNRGRQSAHQEPPSLISHRPS